MVRDRVAYAEEVVKLWYRSLEGAGQVAIIVELFDGQTKEAMTDS